MQKRGLFGMNGFIIFLLCCFSFIARAQQSGYLILLEAENKQAFTVRLGDQFYVSSGHGHLVLSNLKDSVYRLNIRFPKKSRTELTFPVKVHVKDQGFLIQGADSLWVLYNWQTKETIRPLAERDSSRILDQGVKREDGFSRLMAAVVNDSSVMYNTYAGSGFGSDSSSEKAQSVKLKAQSPDSNLRSSVIGHPSSNVPPSALPAETSVKTGHPSSDLPPTVSAAEASAKAANRPPPAEMVIVDKKARKDSLDAIKRTSDSLAAVAKTARKDSLLAVKKTRDSLATAAKLARKDSLLAIKRTQDSLLTASKQPKIKDTINGQRSTANVIPSTVLAVEVSTKAANDQRPTSNGTPSTIKKLREVSLKISRKLVFLDIPKSGLTDTITLFIYFEPAETTVKKESGKPVPAVQTTAIADSTAIINADAARNALATKASESGCGQLATDADMAFLRSAILKANTEDDKIKLATAAFSMKCFSVAQIRVLAGLFVSDKARYRLMEAAHLHIADTEHFHELANMYTDKNFQRKFLALSAKHG